MAAPDVPVWLQQIGALAGTVAVAAGVAWNERRKKHDAEPDQAPAIVAGTLLGGKATGRLVEALDGNTRAIVADGEERHTDHRRMMVAIETLTDELKRNTVAQSQGAVSPADMLGLLGRIGGKP